MKAIKENGKWMEYTSIPKIFLKDGIRTDNYNAHEPSIHIADGWKDLQSPIKTEHQKYGETIDDIDGNPIKEIIDFTQLEIDDFELNKVVIQRELAVEQGVDVDIQGKNVNFKMDTLNNFITQKNEVQALGATDVIWQTEDKSIITIPINEATQKGAEGMVKFQQIYTS